MMLLSTIALIVPVSLLTAVTAVWLLSRAHMPAPAGKASLDAAPDEDVVFLFDGRTLLDATDRARALLPAGPPQTDDWGRFVSAFASRFDGLDASMQGLETSGRTIISENPNDPQSLQLRLDPVDGAVRISVVDPHRENRSELVERYSLAAMRSELVTLRSIAERAPGPTWKQRNDGIITWANSAYMTLARLEAGEDALFGWPPPVMFPGLGPADPRDDASVIRRVSIPSRHSERPHWFDITSIAGDNETLFFAAPADALVKAETTLSEFVQTLTKTFAHLTIGLAIFDRKRQLALFNPALIDLCALPPIFLSGQPTLHAFLDALRDHQRIPEPKDYKSWRLKIAQLEAEAADGTFQEVWDLPNGQTFRVSGRPHPNGAVAFLFEDISSEISLTRRFRLEIELGQSVLDTLPDALAVFSQSGILTMSNAAYTDLWNVEPDSSLTEIGIDEAMRYWDSLCQPGPDWTTLRDFVLDMRERGVWVREARMQDGTALRCFARPLSRGSTLVAFQTEWRTSGASDTAERPAPNGPTLVQSLRLAPPPGPKLGDPPDARRRDPKVAP